MEGEDGRELRGRGRGVFIGMRDGGPHYGRFEVTERYFGTERIDWLLKTVGERSGMVIGFNEGSKPATPPKRVMVGESRR
jgi:hypothetical protein